jgi:hypothetical protein
MFGKRCHYGTCDGNGRAIDDEATRTHGFLVTVTCACSGQLSDAWARLQAYRLRRARANELRAAAKKRAGLD